MTAPVMLPLPPPSRADAARAVGRSAATTARLLASRRLAQPEEYVGTRLTFADGSVSSVFRETALRAPDPVDPAVLVVAFRLRFIGRVDAAHAVFRTTCIVNTPLFAGFPGFGSKLWLTDVDTGVYRGVYQWQGAREAEEYALALTRVLELVSVPGSVRHHVVPGVRREAYLHHPHDALGAAGTTRSEDWWWRLAEPAHVGATALRL